MKWVVPCVAFVTLGLLAAGCGEDQTATVDAGSGAESADAAIRIAGNLSGAGEANASVLVLVYSDLAPEVDPGTQAPSSIGLVDADGRFTVQTPAADTVTVVFLHDKAGDGAVDAGDPIAVLTSSDQKLAGLQAGGRITLTDVQLDFAGKRAVPAGVDIVVNEQPLPGTGNSAAQ